MNAYPEKEGLTENERKLFNKLREIDGDKGYIIGAVLAASEYGIVDDVLQYIEENPGVDSNDIVDYITYEQD